jgi:hypothetical protein
VVVQLLDDHVAHGGLPRRRPSRNPLIKNKQKLTITTTRKQGRAGQGGVVTGMNDLPMTKGCRTAGREASSGAAAAGEAVPFVWTVPLECAAVAALAEEGEDGAEGEERRSASMRRPLKWGPTAASMTSSTAFSGIAAAAGGGGRSGFAGFGRSGGGLVRSPTPECTHRCILVFKIN